MSTSFSYLFVCICTATLKNKTLGNQPVEANEEVDISGTQMSKLSTDASNVPLRLPSRQKKRTAKKVAIEKEDDDSELDEPIASTLHNRGEYTSKKKFTKTGVAL